MSIRITGPLWDVRSAEIPCAGFDALVTELDALKSRIAALEVSDTSQTEEINALRSDLTALEARIAAIEAIKSIANKIGN